MSARAEPANPAAAAPDPSPAQAHPIWRLLRTYAWPHRGHLALGALFLLLTNYLTVTIPIEVGRAIDAIRAAPDPGATGALPHVVAIGVMGALVIVVRTLSRVLIFNPGRDIEYHVRLDLFTKLMAHQPSFYATRTTGDIVSRASNDIAFVRALVGFGLMQVLNVTMAVSLTGWRMVELSWLLTLGVTIPIVVGLAVTRVAIGAVFRLHHLGQEQLGGVSDHVLGSLQGIATIQGFVAEPAFRQRFLARNEALFRTRMKMSVLGALAFPALALSGGVSLFVVLYMGGPMAVSGEISVGEVAAFATLLGVLLPPLRSLGWMLGVIERGRASLERIFELLDAPVDRPEGERPLLPGPRGGPGLRLRDLRFAYPDEPDRDVLHGISADLPAGGVVGIFGRTGSGKTTLLRLVARLYNPPPGAIQVAGTDGAVVDVRALSLEAWRARLAMAPQRPFLFSDTIARNIALSEGVSPDDVGPIVERAALSADLEALPDGLETVVGERGIMLSGGQRQRVALARALAKDADLVILDDVLSAVDHETEARLVAALRASAGGRTPTILVASHRLSALRDAQHILVLENGTLIDQGTHAELCQRPGPYRDAWRVQAPEQEAP